MSLREAIVLCGGLGTRLRSVSGATPKALVDVGGRPFLEILLDHLARQGIERVLLATGYGHELVAGRFGERWGGLRLSYSREEAPLGTGGALARALSLSREPVVLAVNGDTYFDVDVAALATFHEAQSADVSLALKPLADFDRYGTVELAGPRVMHFHEKRPTAAGLVNGGVYVLRRDLFAGEPFDPLAAPPSSGGADPSPAFSFERDYLERRLADRRVCGLVQHGYFVDIGVPADHARACKELGRRRALFLDRDGVINFDRGYVHRPEDFELVPGIGDVLRHFAAQGYLLIVVTNQAGIARGYYSEDEFLRFDAWVREHLRTRFGVTIARTYHAPYHPEGTVAAYRGESELRKPGPGMLLAAQRDFDLDLARSVLIGDRESDIEAGRAAGVGSSVLFTRRPPAATAATLVVDELSGVSEWALPP